MPRLSDDLAEVVTEQEPLSAHTTFRLGGPARWLARPADAGQLARLVRYCREEQIALYPLGLGANLLVSDQGVDGMVLRLSAPWFRQVHWPSPESPVGSPEDARLIRNGGGIVRAGAGVDMHRLVLESVRRGWAGLEVLAGIPGTLGGIIRMNAGGRWGQIADVVREVMVVDPAGRVRRLSPEEVGFSYRHTRLDGAIVCQAALELQAAEPVGLRRRFMDIWMRKRQSQPLSEPSAGCVFKNPAGGLSAGALIEQAGLKGRRIGGARVSELHANFIVTQEGATAADVVDLIGVIRREVARHRGVELELEIQMWGRQPHRVAGQLHA